MDPVLVVGGCGVLGHHIVRKLLAAGSSNITVFDQNTSRNVLPGVTYINGSLLDPSELTSAVRKTNPRTVFHTASPSMLGQRNTPKIFADVNITGTKNLIDALVASGTTNALVYTSSSSVTHNQKSDLVFATENYSYLLESDQPIYYTHTKAEAEKLVLRANRTGPLLTASIRPCSFFGEGDDATAIHMAGARSARAKLQVGPNTNLFDWVYLGNLADAHILAAQALLRVDAAAPRPSVDDDTCVDGEAFFITNDEPWPFWDFPRAVYAEAGRPVRVDEARVVPAWVFYVLAVAAEWLVWATSFGTKESQLNRQMVKYFSMQRTFDISKAKKRLGYRVQVDLKEGIRRAVRAFEENERAGEGKRVD